jgi:CheY-like chemotaxis protein
VTDLAPQLDPIQSDPHQIEQVIMNLAINARDAMPQGGTLRLRTANIYLDAEFVSRHPEVSEGRFVLLALSDTGSGIPEDILPKIFEPFFTTKERGRGTGLGLSTVYGIVRQSQGYVFAENVPGQGARISVYFPVSADDAPAGATPVEADGELHGTEQILLVEDEESVRRLTESILTGSGYRVVATANAQQALQLADSQLEQTSLLITDVVMPGMNGRGLARTLRRRFPELKVLYVTGYAPSPAGTQVVEDNDKELLLKPFSRLDLLRRVRQLTDG